MSIETLPSEHDFIVSVKETEEIIRLMLKSSNSFDYDKRKIAIAKTNFEQAFLWLNSAMIYNGETNE